MDGVAEGVSRVPLSKPPRAAHLNLPEGRSLHIDTSQASSLFPAKQRKGKAASGTGLRTSNEAGSPSPSRALYSDRFIPSRISSNLNCFALEENPSFCSNNQDVVREDGAATYSTLLKTELFGAELGPSSPSAFENSRTLSARDIVTNGSPLSPCKNLFKFRTVAGSTAKPESPYLLSPVGVDGAFSDSVNSPRKTPRKIPRSPYKVLDAPALQDDFYLNLVDWSSRNILSVGLGTCVYLWSASNSKVTKLCDLGPNDAVCSVGWTQRGTYLAVGTTLGEVQIWDPACCKKVRTMGGHGTRVGCLSWNSTILSSGSRDRSILHHDIRAQDDFVSKLTGHKSEVCGLKWSYDDRELASGGNDNQLLIWGQQGTQPMLRFREHTAAVKAIAWSPHQSGLLASGGGTADRCIRIWNTSTNTHQNSVDTGSQVCNLVWSKNVNEIVSTHGYSQNQIIVWRYPSMSKLVMLTGHSFRVLYLAISPDGQTIVTGAGDETLRFWSVFPSPKSQNVVRDEGLSCSLVCTHIR